MKSRLHLTRYSQRWQVETVNSFGQTMILIPPGEFLMGSTPEDIEQKMASESEHKESERERAREAVPRRGVPASGIWKVTSGAPTATSVPSAPCRR